MSLGLARKRSAIISSALPWSNASTWDFPSQVSGTGRVEARSTTLNTYSVRTGAVSRRTSLVSRSRSPVSRRPSFFCHAFRAVAVWRPRTPSSEPQEKPRRCSSTWAASQSVIGCGSKAGAVSGSVVSSAGRAGVSSGRKGVSVICARPTTSRRPKLRISGNFTE